MPAAGGGAGCGVLFLGVVLVRLLAELFPLVGVVFLFPGGGVAPCTTGDLLVLNFDPCWTGDTLGGGFDFFLSTVHTVVSSSSSPKYLTPPLIPVLVVG